MASMAQGFLEPLILYRRTTFHVCPRSKYTNIMKPNPNPHKNLCQRSTPYRRWVNPEINRDLHVVSNATLTRIRSLLPKMPDCETCLSTALFLRIPTLATFQRLDFQYRIVLPQDYKREVIFPRRKKECSKLVFIAANILWFSDSRLH
jgi:hypothetical protein